MENIEQITECDLISLDQLLDAYLNYLRVSLGYSKAEAEICLADMEDPYMCPYLQQDYEGTVIVAGTTYEVRSCRTEFLSVGLYYPNVEPFRFLMLINQGTLTGSTVGEYIAAEKAFVLNFPQQSIAEVESTHKEMSGTCTLCGETHCHLTIIDEVDAVCDDCLDSNYVLCEECKQYWDPAYIDFYTLKDGRCICEYCIDEFDEDEIEE